MLILDAGCPVRVLRFAPDGCLLAGSGYPNGRHEPPREPAFIDVWTLPAGTRVRVPLADGSWKLPEELAVTPDGAEAWAAVNGRLVNFNVETGAVRLDTHLLSFHAIALSPDGDRAVLAHVEYGNQTLHGAVGVSLRWERKLEAWNGRLAGFLPDGDRFVMAREKRVDIHSFVATGELVESLRYRIAGVSQPQLSPDGRYLATVGYGNMYVCDLSSPGAFGKIDGGSNFGDFRSFAFHPAGRSLAVIHGGPTLVKVYDLATLKLKHKLNWKLGALLSVAFSPDGTLAAAGSADGRIVVWDVDE
jgi:WD40 repeat protein